MTGTRTKSRDREVIDLDDPACRVRLVANPRARRFTLRLDGSGDGAVLTAPPDVPRREMLSFLQAHKGWLSKALESRPRQIPVEPGVHIPIDGIDTLIVVKDGPRRPPHLGDGELVLQGRGEPGPRVAAWLKMRARDAVLPLARGYARKLGKPIGRISLKDTRSRWGSCSSRGTLSFSWRLAMAPPEVLDYVAAHEAAHLVEMNHSERYWAVLASLMPDYADHRAWLKREGRQLHAYRFEAS